MRPNQYYRYRCDRSEWRGGCRFLSVPRTCSLYMRGSIKTVRYSRYYWFVIVGARVCVCLFRCCVMISPPPPAAPSLYIKIIEINIFGRLFAESNREIEEADNEPTHYTPKQDLRIWNSYQNLIRPLLQSSILLLSSAAFSDEERVFRCTGFVWHIRWYQMDLICSNMCEYRPNSYRGCRLLYVCIIQIYEYNCTLCCTGLAPFLIFISGFSISICWTGTRLYSSAGTCLHSAAWNCGQ